MYKTILVPLDGSKRAETILPHVEQLAQHYGATVILLQVVEPAPRTSGMEPDYAAVYLQQVQRQGTETEAYLEALRVEFRAKGIKSKPIVVSGPIVEAILNAAECEGVDLIAMASHGRTGLGQVFYGSVAAGVLHRVDRPLLLIRSQGEQ